MGTARSKQTDTKTHILDVAERLFAKNGFRLTSIKLLSRMAGVNQAAVNYHFGSKHALIEKVIERRLAPINALRLKRFKEIDESISLRGCEPDIATILYSYIEPAFIMTETLPKDRSFLTIISRAFSEPDDDIRKIFINYFKSSSDLLFELMKKALPDLPENVVWWRLNFVIGAMAHCMHLCGSSPLIENSFPHADDADTVVRLLVPFLSSGMAAPHYENQ